MTKILIPTLCCVFTAISPHLAVAQGDGAADAVSPPPVESTLGTTVVEAQPSYTEQKPARAEVRTVAPPTPAPAPASTPAPSPPPVINDAAPVASAPPVMAVDTLVLTPSRVVESNFTSPFVVDTISETALRDRAVRSVPEAFEQTPGVTVQKTAHGQGSPFIRGFTAYHNLFLVDGVRLNNSVFRSGPNQYWNTVDSQGLAGIELVKSQGSVLYGSDAVGGTVQALTRRPVYIDDAGVHTSGRSYSRYASGENSFVQRAEYSVSEADKYGFIIGGTYKDFGNIKAADLGELPFTGYEEWDVDAKLELFLNEDTRLTFFHQQVHLDDAWRVHKTQFGRSWAGTTVGSDQSRVLDQHRVLSYVSLEGDSYSTPWFDHYQLTVSHQRQDEEQSRVRSDGRLDIQGFTVNTIGTNFQFDKYLDKTDLTYGISYYHDQIESFRDDFNADGSFNRSRIQGAVGDDGSYDLFGAFINSSTELSERLRLDLGSRYTYARADIGRVQDPTTGGVTSIDESWQNLVGSGRISYQLDELDRVRLFGAVSQSFRAPNLSDLSRFSSARSNEIETPAPGLDPENFVTYEIGVKTDFGKLSSVASYYYTDVDGMILRSPTGRVIDGDNEVTKSNSGDGHVQGVELTFEYDWSDQIDLFGGFAYQDSQVTTFATSAPILSEEPLTRLMPTNGYIGARWTSADERLWLEGITRVVDRADRLSTSDIRDTQRIPPGGTPGYTLWTLRSGWQATDRMHINAAVENIFDQPYRAHGSGQNEPGVNFVLGVDVKF